MLSPSKDNLVLGHLHHLTLMLGPAYNNFGTSHLVPWWLTHNLYVRPTELQLTEC